jgi:parallel beta-helix repeat protein
MRRKLVSVIFFVLLLIGFLNSAKIQPVEVAVCSGYEANLARAALFLNSTQFDSAVGLCREAPNAHNNTFWLVSDNLLAYHALKYYYPETAETVYATMLGYGYFRSFKHEVVFGTTIPYIPFKTNNTYVVAQIGTKVVETEVCNGSSMDDYKEYADLCIFAALHFYWSGDIPQAIDHYNIAKNMWNGTLHGVYDKASKDAENKSETLIFSTYKLSLLLYCSRILGQPLEDRNSIEETLWLMQDGEYGGLHTDYDISLNYTGSDMNTETTSFAVLAYKYEPKIVNRPVQYPPSLNIPPDYQKIQEAVNSANEGDTVFVYNGAYYENVDVNKTVSLIGENRESTVIDGNSTGSVVNVTASKVNIAGFTIQRSGGSYLDCGIYVCPWSTSNNISCNFITKNSQGIYLDSSSENLVSNNTVSNNSIGICLHNSSGNAVHGNIAISNIGGIYLANSGDNTLFNNNMTDNTYNFGISWESHAHLFNSIDVTNTVDGKPIYYLKNINNTVYDAWTNAGIVYLINCTHVTIKDMVLKNNFFGLVLVNTNCSKIDNVTTSSNLAGIVLWSSHNNTVSGNCAYLNGGDGISLISSSNNLISNNIASNNSWEGISLLLSSSNNIVSGNSVHLNKDDGIQVGSTSSSSNNNTVSSNYISNNDWGIDMRSSENNRIFSNNVSSNNWDGIDLYDSNNNSLFGNDVCSNHQFGIYLYASESNLIVHNNFVDNSRQHGEDWSQNFYDDGAEGNYWSNYKGLDSNHNGIGDTRYIIDAYNTDRYPLMGMFHSFNTSVGKYVNVISNSTIEDFEYFESNSTIIMHVSNMTSNQTFGFIRICIPHALMNETYHVTIDGAEPYYVNYTLYDNGTHRWIYFNYEHSILEIIIVPEFPSFLILPLFMIISLLFLTIRHKYLKFRLRAKVLSFAFEVVASERMELLWTKTSLIILWIMQGARELSMLK